MPLHTLTAALPALRPMSSVATVSARVTALKCMALTATVASVTVP